MRRQGGILHAACPITPRPQIAAGRPQEREENDREKFARHDRTVHGRGRGEVGGRTDTLRAGPHSGSEVVSGSRGPTEGTTPTAGCTEETGRTGTGGASTFGITGRGGSGVGFSSGTGGTAGALSGSGIALARQWAGWPSARYSRN